MPILVVESGPLAGRRIDLASASATTLGRSTANSLVLDEGLVSERHASVEFKNGTWLLRDLGSTNGTLVNGNRVESQGLVTGDRITLGSSVLRFVADPQPARTNAPDRLLGTVIGGYKILDRLGKGGMGVVYKANQQSLDRIVALKVLSPKLAADPAFVKKFSDEAQAAGRLNHPNIVQVYDVGHDGTHHFYSMEYIERGSVQALIDRTPGPLDLDLALAIVADAARGLVFAEKKSIVHRDIKPDNLMINAEGIVKIADLGLALDPGKGDDMDRILGTPHYISPEQAQGLAVDIRSDLYSLGATWFRLVAGRTVFDSSDVKEIVRRQIEESPQSVRELNRNLSQDVSSTIDRLLSKDPAARYPSAQALLDVVEHIGKPKSGIGLKVALIGALVLVMGAVWYIVANRDAPPAPPVSPVVIREGETPEEKAVRERVEAEKQARETAAKDAFVAAQTADTEAAKSEKPDFAPVKALYDNVASDFPGTTSAELAANRAKAIGELLAALAERDSAATRQAESRTALLRESLAKANEKAKPLIENHRFGEACGAIFATRILASNAGESAEVDSAIETIIKAAEAVHKSALAKAKASEQAGRTDEACADLESLSAHFIGGAPPVAARRLEPLVKSMFEESSAIRRRVGEKRDADLSADLLGAFDARRESGKLAAAAFDADRSLIILNTALSKQRLGAGKQELESEISLVKSVVSVRDRFIAYAKATPDLKVKLPSPQDRRKLLDFSLTSVTPQGVTAKRGSTEVTVGFSAAGAAEAYDTFFSHVPDRSTDAIRDLISFHVWSGRPEKALELLGLLSDATERERATAIVRHEQEGWELWTRIRELLPKATATDDAALGALERASARLLNELWDTRASLLNRRAPAPPKQR